MLSPSDVRELRDSGLTSLAPAPGAQRCPLTCKLGPARGRGDRAEVAQAGAWLLVCQHVAFQAVILGSRVCACPARIT